ncbi:diguanylate cyclase [Halobiforma lacisalsi AJ5]|uniref:Diguanylate cyclase n=1 Tax=Natronobacterium lacisalsi AJ5 TaxID=358396 RepID=M0LSN2_NATLA|nr:bacterio-opsin activator domain-containing protein [Halobiforma lacisalsi]APW96831.1 diguanylate cyclase [Halobiforma lacisalsi AJ5]EMA35105.1 response regulator receiver modulated GAF sensor protein [Halobiforma lacisalsi AJ5]
MTDRITVLVVDNEPGFAELACEMLEREREAIDAEPATSPDEALERLDAPGDPPVDCIVSDYEMPGTTGLELLERVREDDPDLPFILFTGKGSEAVASEAIDAGVSQYLRKETGSEQYAVLANEVVNAVEQYRTENELRANERRYQRTVTTLHETTRELMRAESKAEIYRTAVDTARDVLEAATVAAYAFEPTDGALELVASTGECPAGGAGTGAPAGADVGAAAGTGSHSGRGPGPGPGSGPEPGGGRESTANSGVDAERPQSEERGTDTTLEPTADRPVDRFERGEGAIWDAFSEGESATLEGRGPADAITVGTEADATPAPTAPGRSELIVPLGTHGVLVAGTDREDGFDGTMTELLHVLSANAEAALDRAEREELLRERDRTLTRQNEELTRLNHTNEIVREINHGIARASTREEIETTVCERLADTDRYRFAWIATTDDPPEPTAWAGVDATYVDRLRDDGERAPERELVREALEHERVSVVGNVLEADGWDRRRKEALTHGFQTVLAVPLVGEERHHGALVVHVGGVDSIGDRERAVLSELGETIGHAIRSVERTRAMLDDGRLELELECRDERLLFNRLSARVGRATLEGIVDRSEDEAVGFVSVPEDADVDALEDESASVESITTVSAGDDERLLEVTTEPTPFLDVVRRYDVRVRTMTGDDGTSTVVLEVPQRVDARELVEAIRTEYPETELSARRETNAVPSARQLDTHLEERLTAKQLEALQAAHYGGFFEWPRESTGEDLAAALDVSAPTYHYHLRAAERKLAALAFDGL